jgi:long-subunit acyl-CoA synthetase (AMP-forming)
MYTSGTTGRSKGAMITHNNVMATVTGLLAAWAWEQDDRLLLCLPKN